MAIEHVSTGPCMVNFYGTDLGYSEDGADIRYEPRFIDVFSDDYGGRSGAPADTQLVGIVGSVQVSLTHFDDAEVRKMASFSKGGSGLSLPPLGTFMRQGEKTGPLILTGTNKTRTFATAFPREPQSVNAGTKFETYQCQFEFWINDPSNRAFQVIT